ncbi:CDKN2A-interacting protein [Gouania willdenowi]|uniref:CDKN2A-interacting protein-like n=1 Tax=Gouania willdenowi TaxID=441366 RepID=A0A8C5EQK8_GOUWI|nr:CDKN2A-interacting protein-like [Gouania willdenowi]XP_028330474.1 CDKN2A-interacting protein-like [Gouania willdenowi]XP_028330484.1 CDKN2A-interacting protein-like [Gouania willdenowi]XP_028330494.1 CDKN2A-interacting protein-like [Gouania willdenowi]XP_028330503.1 CDKN2A-interacting protein-like [Gouania willdenowi]XP_028330511.1 CDKN2A-interacting protein-like [Gouania willdenowi]
MADQRSGEDLVSEYLGQNRQLAQWVETQRSYNETSKQWVARREFILRNMEAFPSVQPGVPSTCLDRLLSLSMVWANQVFMGCSYPPAVMEKIQHMGEGIVVEDAPIFKSANSELSRGKRGAADESDAESLLKKAKTGPNEVVARATRPQKMAPPPQAPAEHQPFFNRLYKAVAWKLVSAGGFGPNLDHFEILRSCVESCKQTLTCVFVPLKDIAGLPASRTQKEGHVCEIRCHTVYLGTGYGRDEAAARAMASKEALKVFQGCKVTVKICRRRFKGRDVEDLLLLDEQPRSQGFPPALSYPFQDEQGESDT